MALSSIQSDTGSFAGHILDSLSVGKYNKTPEEKLQVVDLEISVSNQRLCKKGPLLTLEIDSDQHLPAAAGGKSCHSSTITSDVREATAAAINIPHDRIHPESADELSCSICTENMSKSQDIRVLSCKHIYHKCCIDPWLLHFGANCPLWYVLKSTPSELRMNCVYLIY
jgi:hypothetical protein